MNGGRLAFVIGTFRHALLPLHLDPRDVHIRVRDRWDEITLACVWMTEPGLDLTGDRMIGGPLPLTSGRCVWVTAKTEKITPATPQPLAVSSMLEPVWPGQHNVSSPGVLHHGVYLDTEANSEGKGKADAERL